MRAAVIFQLDKVERPQRVLEAWFEALTLTNVSYLRANPGSPSIYASGVVYREEGSPEIWRDIPTVTAHGWGDCDDLACWLAAELRVRHQRRAVVSLQRQTTPGLWHAVVRDIDTGATLDPSRKLGMR
jgi:hypothetical protein